MKDYTVNVQLATYSKDGKDTDKETGILFDVYGQKVQNRFRLKSALYVKEKDFNKANKDVKRSDPHYTTKNERLKERLRAVEKLCEKLVNEDKIITKLYLETQLDFIDNANGDTTFLPHFDEFLKSKKNEISEGTKGKYELLRTRLIEVSDHCKRPLTFDNMDAKFESSFKDYCINVLGNFNNGFGAHIKNLKAFLKWASEPEINLHRNLAFKKFTVVSEEKDIFPLEFAEIAQLEKVQLKGELEVVQHMFLVQCYTGMAIGDIIDLKYSHIHTDVIKKKRIKTKVDCFIPITPKAERIIELYRRRKDKKDTSITVFPEIAEHRINDLLKDLFDKAKLYRQVTYERTQGVTVTQYTDRLCDIITPHDGRRTFITCCLRKGMSYEIIMKITGHKTYNEFRKYVKFSEKEIKGSLLYAWSEA